MNRREILEGLLTLCSTRGLDLVQTTEPRQRAELVSMIRLIANPDQFDGRRLRLNGYLENNGLDRSLGLYVSEVDGRHFVISNSVDLPRLEWSSVREKIGKYVVLEATFHAPKGSGARFLNGHLDHVSELQVVPAPG